MNLNYLKWIGLIRDDLDFNKCLMEDFIFVKYN